MRRELRFVTLLILIILPGMARAVIDLKGRPVSPLASTNITVLLFVRSDCPISNRYAPEIRRLASRYSSSVTFWLVYPDRDESADSIRAHLARNGLHLRVARDPEHELVKIAGATITPEAALFSPTGKLLYHGRINNLYSEPGKSRPRSTENDLQIAIEAAKRGELPPQSSVAAVGCYIADLK